MKRLFLFLWASIFLVTSVPFSYAALKDYEIWMGTYFQGEKLGFTHTKLEIEAGEIVIHTKVFLRLESEGVDQSTTVTQNTYLTPDLKLKHFFLIQELMGHRQKVEAEMKSDRLGIQITSSDFKKKDSILFHPTIAPSATYLINILRSGLNVGKKGKISILVEPFQKVADLTYFLCR